MQKLQKELENLYPRTYTRTRKIIIIDSFIKWCFEQDYLTKDVSRGLKPVKPDREEKYQKETSALGDIEGI
jgi:hypothetical protein